MVFSALAVLLPAAGHLVVTGRPLPVDTLLLAGGAVLAVALPLTGRERSYLQIAATLLPVELGLNALFNSAQDHCAAAHPGASGDWPGLLICGGGSVRPGLLGVHPATSPHALAVMTADMVLCLLLLHVVIALLVAAWLRRGEVALFTVLRIATVLAWTGLAALLAWFAAPAPLPLAPAWRVPPLRRPGLGPQDVLRRTSTRRGPPVVAPAC